MPWKVKVAIYRVALPDFAMTQVWNVQQVSGFPSELVRFDGLCMYFGVHVCAMMPVGKIRCHLVLQHVNLRCFLDFGASLADSMWFCGLMHS